MYVLPVANILGVQGSYFKPLSYVIYHFSLAKHSHLSYSGHKVNTQFPKPSLKLQVTGQVPTWGA